MMDEFELIDDAIFILDNRVVNDVVTMGTTDIDVSFIVELLSIRLRDDSIITDEVMISEVV